MVTVLARRDGVRCGWRPKPVRRVIGRGVPVAHLPRLILTVGALRDWEEANSPEAKSSSIRLRWVRVLLALALRWSAEMMNCLQSPLDRERFLEGEKPARAPRSHTRTRKMATTVAGSMAGKLCVVTGANCGIGKVRGTNYSA